MFQSSEIFCSRLKIKKDHTENEAEKPFPGLFLFFKKALYEVKASGLQLSFNIFQ